MTSRLPSLDGTRTARRLGPAERRLSWAVPLVPIAFAGFFLSALTYYRVRGPAGDEHGLAGVVAALYRFLGFEPAFMFWLLVMAWGSIWFITGRLDRLGGRLARIAGLTLCLAILINLRPGSDAVGDNGVLGEFLAQRMQSAFGSSVSTILIAVAALASLLLATDFFFYRHFEGLTRSAVGDAVDDGVEPAAVEALKGLRLEPAAATPRPRPPRAAAVSLDVDLPVLADEEGTDSGDAGIRRWYPGDDDELDLVALGEDRSATAMPTGADVPNEGPDPWQPTGSECGVDVPDASAGTGSERDASEPDDPEDDDSEDDAPVAVIPLPDDEPDVATAFDEAFDEEAEEVPATVVDDDAADLQGIIRDRRGRVDEVEAEAAGGVADPATDPFGFGVVATGSGPEPEPPVVLELGRESNPQSESEPRDVAAEPEGACELPEVAAQAPAEAVVEAAVELPRPPQRQGSLFAPTTVDPDLVDEAASLVVEYRRASANFLRRRLRISAAEAIDVLAALRERGIVECEDGSAHGRVVA
jgi:hypothetical protein